MKTLTQALWFAFMSQAPAITVILDYTSSPFFDTNTPNGQLAKAAVDKAAADVSHAITTNLAAIPTSSFTGTNGSTTATYNARLQYTNPDTGGTVTLNSFSLAENEFRIYVGARVLGGNTLGQGGPGAESVNISGSGSSNQWVGAVANMQSAANTGLLRGQPQLATATFSGTVALGGTPANFSVNHAPTVGNLWFDVDRDAPDWNLNHTIPVPMGTVDLYSVAVHEILHTLGFGIGTLWEKNIDGNLHWTGTEILTHLGVNGPLADFVDGGHIKEIFTGYAIIDGLLTSIEQSSIMTASISAGERKYITDLDLAVIRDMGFQTIPEPSALLLSGLSIAIMLRGRRSGRFPTAHLQARRSQSPEPKRAQPEAS